MADIDLDPKWLEAIDAYMEHQGPICDHHWSECPDTCEGQIAWRAGEAMGRLRNAAPELLRRARELEAAKALLGTYSRVLVELYTAGYLAGHHHTVEGGYVHVHPSDESTYFRDDVNEWLEARAALRQEPTT